MTAPNTAPRFILTNNLTPVRFTAANTSSDGGGTIGTDSFLLFTAGAQGSVVDYINFNVVASAAATAWNASVIRLFVSTQSSGAISNANTFLFGEWGLSAGTADQTTTASGSLIMPCNLWLPSGKNLLIMSHIVAPTSVAYVAMAAGNSGDF